MRGKQIFINHVKLLQGLKSDKTGRQREDYIMTASVLRTAAMTKYFQTKSASLSPGLWPEVDVPWLMIPHATTNYWLSCSLPSLRKAKPREISQLSAKLPGPFHLSPCQTSPASWYRRMLCVLGVRRTGQTPQLGSREEEEEEERSLHCNCD